VIGDDSEASACGDGDAVHPKVAGRAAPDDAHVADLAGRYSQLSRDDLMVSFAVADQDEHPPDGIEGQRAKGDRARCIHSSSHRHGSEVDEGDLVRQRLCVRNEKGCHLPNHHDELAAAELQRRARVAERGDSSDLVLLDEQQGVIRAQDESCRWRDRGSSRWRHGRRRR
jgi:hypothetical protein